MMATLRALVKTALSGDGQLAALLTGGFLDASDLPRDGGGINDAPKESDGVRIAPFCITRFRESNELQPEALSPEAETIEIYIYEDTGYAVIDPALTRIYKVLHKFNPVPDDRDFAYFWRTHISGEMLAEEYAYAPMRFIRFAITTIR